MVSLVVVNLARVWQVRATMGMLLRLRLREGDGRRPRHPGRCPGRVGGHPGPARPVRRRSLALAVYVGMLLLLGLPADDRILLGQMTRGHKSAAGGERSGPSLVAAGRS